MITLALNVAACIFLFGLAIAVLGFIKEFIKGIFK